MEIKAIERVSQGREAAMRQLPREANPYPNNSGHATQWDHGYVWFGKDLRFEETFAEIFGGKI